MRTHPFTVLAVLASMLLVGSLAIDAGVEPPAPPSTSTAPTPYSVSITPDGDGSGTKYTNTSGHTASFTITYAADEYDDPETFSLWCDGTLGIQCSVQWSIQLYPNSPQNVDVTFSTSSSTGTGYVNLYSYGWSTSFQDQGSRSYTISLPVTVDPLSVPSSVIQHSQDETATFNVTNTSGSAKTYTMTCEWGAGSCAPSPASAYVTNGQDTTVTVTFDAGAIPASYNLKLTATSGSDTDYDQQSVTVSEFLSVNAVAENAEVYVVPSVADTVEFEVRFPGQSASSFAMSAACTGGATSCGVVAADQTKSVGDTPVTVQAYFTAGGNGNTSTLTLTATKSGATWVTNAGSLKLIATNEILVSVDDANPGLEVDRGECLTVAAGAGAIVCDDFQYAYPFTPVSRLGRARQIALIHNHALRYPGGVIGADFVLPPGAAEPDSIKATLVVNGNTIRTQSYASSLYAPGEKTRIAFDFEDWTHTAEQLLKYDVTLQPWSGGSAGTSVTKSGKFLSLDHDTRYGRGWWIAGLEKLSVHGTDTLIWTGADASGAVYIKSSTKWIRQTRSVPDTITESGSTYIRSPIGGGAVHFNSSGFHTKTVDRNGNETRFNYATVASWTRLASVELPDTAATDTVYQVHYNSSTGGMDSVRVRASASTWNTYRVFSRDISGQGLHIDSITAPDGVKTRFTGAHGQLTEVRGPRGDTTAISYAYGRVTEVRVKTVDVSDVVLDYQASSVVGRATSGWAAPRRTDHVSSRIDGPLSGSADTTRLYTTGWGAVRGIRDALGDETWVDRQDTAFPALPTRVRYPNGWQQTTAYTAGGLPDTVIDRSTGAVTTYTWNTTWRQPATVTSPEGIVTNFTYDGNGNRLAQRVVSDSVRFHYNAQYLVDQVTDARGKVSEFGYDADGNLLWEETPLNVRTRYLRDYVGRDTMVVSATNSIGDSIRASQRYDVLGRPTTAVRRNDWDAKWDSTVTTYDSSTGDRTRVEAWGGRTSGTPTDSIGASEWFYDDLGRVTVAKTPVTADTMQYDLAGRVTKSISNGDTISMTYDALGRLRSRRTTAESYAYDQAVNGWYFPVFATSGLTFAAQVDTFTYDVMGNTLTANNPFAQITRTYALNGALETDQQAIGKYADSTFATHVFQLGHAYNRDGQRAALYHPTALSPGTDRTDYTYSGTTGRLTSVRDALGDVYAFTYNANGQPTVMTFPSGVDSLSYDDDGRLTALKARTGALGSIVNDGISYDPAGRIAYGVYDGLGHLERAELGVGGMEYFERDAFGNAVVEQSWIPGQTPASPGTKWNHTHPARMGGRLWYSEEEWEFGSIAEPEYWSAGQAERWHDLRGNGHGTYENKNTWSYYGGEEGYAYAELVTNYRLYSKSYHASDGKLRVHQINRDSVDHRDYPFIEYGDPWGAYEEYWYDALGRRVMKRSRQESPTCTDGDRCYSSIERYVWDGDQLLWETRQADAGDSAVPSGGDQTGVAGYVHAGALDAPLAVILNNTAVILHRNWRGLVVDATNDAGARLGSGVPWPGVNWDAKMGYPDPRDVTTWFGSLAMDQQDRTGLSYKRNRYYDPASGQFTQSDPIGIAGGINLYGYANGDPYNFSDPFGLKCEGKGGAGRDLTSGDPEDHGGGAGGGKDCSATVAVAAATIRTAVLKAFEALGGLAAYVTGGSAGPAGLGNPDLSTTRPTSSTQLADDFADDVARLRVHDQPRPTNARVPRGPDVRPGRMIRPGIFGTPGPITSVILLDPARIYQSLNPLAPGGT